MTLEATVIRADGTREPRGIIAGYDVDPVEQAKLEVLGAGHIDIPHQQEFLI